MNATYNNNNNNNNKKPFCKVCADAGKTDNAHYVRLTPDPKSPVVCPTLLALECRYCFKSGHTVKYCPLAKKNNKIKMDRARHTTSTTTTTVTEKISTNKFDVLMDDSDDDEYDTVKLQQFPPLAPLTSQTASTNTWAKIAKASAHIQQPIHKPIDNTCLNSYEYNCHYEDDDDHENQSILSDSNELTLEEKYGEILYQILYEYHHERTGKIVGMLLQCDIEELEQFIQNRNYLQERVDEACALLQQAEIHINTPTPRRIIQTEDDDW
jgi:hypothetical protein